MSAASTKFSLATHVPVEEGAEFELNGRFGKVVQMRMADCLVLWNERFDAESGEVIAPIAAIISNSDFVHFDLHGRLRIIRRPSAVAAAGERDMAHRSPKEIRRMRHRQCFASAAERLIKDGKLEGNRASFMENLDLIRGMGMVHYNEYLRKDAGDAPKRAGAKVNLGPQLNPPKSGATLFRWYGAFRRHGANGLFDEYMKSGNRIGRYRKAERDLVASVISHELDEERQSISEVVKSVQSVFRVHNEGAALASPPGELLVCPAYEYIRNTIDKIAPLDHAIRTRGLKVAYKDMHALGVGIKTDRALERVEADEYTVDLMVILNATGLWTWMTAEEREMLGLDGTPRRVVMSAALDVHTLHCGNEDLRVRDDIASA